MQNKFLIYGGLVFIYICAVANLKADENQNFKIRILYADQSEILFPADGFFDLKELHYYSIHSDGEKMTSINYENWKPVNIESSPTFYSTHVSDDQKSEINTYYLRNNKYVTDRISLINEYHDQAGASHAWSMSSRANVVWNSAFNVNVFNQNLFSSGNRDSVNNQIMLEYFHNDQNYIDNIVVLDLSDSFIHGELFNEIANLPKLEKLALPLNGSPLSHPLFKPNPNVRELVVFNTILSDDVVKRISNFPGLQRLVLVGCSADQFFSDKRNFDALQIISERLSSITLLNCTQEAISILEAVEWKKLQFGTFDFIPSGVAVEKLFSNADIHKEITIVVDKKYSDSFEGFAKANLMSRFKLSDEDQLIIINGFDK